MTNIEWTDETWNPARGCTRVSPGCENCYAERQAIRFAGPGASYDGLVKITNGHPQWTGTIRENRISLEVPLFWKKPRRIFVNSMSDLFHPGISRDFLMDVFVVMRDTPRHTYQILTKRAEHMVQVMPFVLDIVNKGKPLPNVWLGVSVEDQKRADERIPRLLQTPAAIRFLSVEPQLEYVNVHLPRSGCIHPSMDGISGITREDDRIWQCNLCDGYVLQEKHPTKPGYVREIAGIHWVICGGESGPGARPFNLAWAESLLKQCRAAGVPFFMKQVGSHPVWQKDGTFYEPGATQVWHDRKGGDPLEWPEHLRVREFPAQTKEEATA